MASLIVAPQPGDLKIVNRGLELIGVETALEAAGVTWQGTAPLEMVQGVVAGIFQNVDSVRKLLSVTFAMGIELPSRGTYRFLADTDHDLRAVLRAGVAPQKTRPSDLLILDESPNVRTGRSTEGTSLVHSTCARGRFVA